MKALAWKWPVAGLIILGMAGCQTTGDPNQGGLFGWNEGKAQQRIAEKKTTLAQEETKEQADRRTAANLRGTVQSNDAELAAQQQELGALLANAESMEQEAPTPAEASRARRLSQGIDRVRQNTGLAVADRRRMLREFAVEVNRLRVDWAQSSGEGSPR